jgi:hypothetical protein
MPSFLFYADTVNNAALFLCEGTGTGVFSPAAFIEIKGSFVVQ